MTKKKEKIITNTELLESINRSFSNIEKKMATKEDLENLEKRMATKTDIEGLKDQIHGVNKRIDDFAENKISKVAYKELENRVQKIEAKL